MMGMSPQDWGTIAAIAGVLGTLLAAIGGLRAWRTT